MYKRRVMIMSVCIVGLLLLSACAENPEGDIIANKNENTFEEALNTENNGDSDQNEIKHYEDTFEVEKDSLSVTVDANVKPIEGDIPVLRVIPHTYTVEDAKKWAKILFGDNSVYDAKHVMTKSEIEECILELKSWINDPEELLQRYGAEIYVQEAIEDFKKEIALWEKQYADAPDTWEVPEADWEFHPLTYYDDGVVDDSSDEISNLNKTEEIQITAYPNGEQAILSLVNRNESDYLLHMLSFYYKEEIELAENSQPVELTEEEAVDLAQEWIDHGDIGEWEVSRVTSLIQETENDALASASEAGSDYMIYFAPVYEGVSSLWTEADVDIHSEDIYSAHLWYTSLDIRICNGQLMSIGIKSPMDVVEVENENISVLSFDEIYEAFRNYAVSGLKSDIVESNWSMQNSSVTVTRIEQILYRAKVKNSDTEFRMIPVWVFYGTVDDYPEEHELAVINAVDGSVVNLQLGY